LFVAEREGRVRVVRDGQLLADPALSLREDGSGLEQLLALAIDPRFDRTHFVYAVYTTTTPSGDATFSLARFREVASTLADRILLLDGIPAARVRATAALRFGVDGKLFVAFDDGGDPRVGGDLASPNGKVLRLNPDGTTPDDQAAGSPVYSYPYRSPTAFDFQPTSGLLWIADVDSASSGRLSAVESAGGSRNRGVLRGAFRLPEGDAPSSLAFYHAGAIAAFAGNLLIASENGGPLLRLTFDPLVPSRVVSTERLLGDLGSGVRLVTVGTDGAIYVATDRAIGRLR
jgi:glucose/arabinose dehydrogenase